MISFTCLSSSVEEKNRQKSSIMKSGRQRDIYVNKVGGGGGEGGGRKSTKQVKTSNAK